MDELVRQLKESGIIVSESIERAFRAVDRKEFVPPEYADEAYDDYPLPIGAGQTISQPSTVAIMLELLGTQPGERVLDVGVGSGWTTALLAHIVGGSGHVVGVERIPELVALGKKNTASCRRALGNIDVRAAGVALGFPVGAPFDRILVSAATETVPDELAAQLAPDGTMVIPVGSDVCKVTKSPSGTLTIKKYSGFAFVPLVRGPAA